jgi:AAA family ATP:ADP antiporter
MAVLLLGVVPLYGAVASAVSRIRLINGTTLVVMGTLVLFWLWGRATGVGTAIGLSFYVYIGIVNVFLIAQFWSFANDIYTESVGAVFGPKIAGKGADDVFLLLLVSAGIFAVCLLLYNVINSRVRREHAEEEGFVDEAEQPLEKGGGFQLVLTNRYLLLIACMVLVSNLVNTTGEYILSNAALTHAEEQVPSLPASAEAAVSAKAEQAVQQGRAANLQVAEKAARDEALRGARSEVIGRFYGDFFFWVNLVGVMTQMFLVSRIFKYAGVRAALFVLPVIAFGGYMAIGLIGGLAVLRVAKTAENSTDYSLQNTVKQALFLPTSREAKYKAKAAIDTFFVRFGDTASAGLIWVGLHLLLLEARDFAFVCVGLVVIWLLLNVGIAKEHKKLIPDDRGQAL